MKVTINGDRIISDVTSIEVNRPEASTEAAVGVVILGIIAWLVFFA